MISRCAVFLLTYAAAASAFADDNWPRFRGPNGSGISESKNPPVQIQLDSAIRWKVAVPKGVSSPCIWGKQLFFTAFADGKLWTLAYDRGDGPELCRAAAPATQSPTFHPSARS